MGIEINSSAVICCKCGKAYGNRKSYFQVSYGAMYKGTGYLTVCKSCVDKMYSTYLSQCNDAAKAVRQVCRSLNLYWSEKIFNIVQAKSTNQTVMGSYIRKLNSVAYVGRSYDDTLLEDGTMWLWKGAPSDSQSIEDKKEEKPEKPEDEEDIPDEIKAFWGAGYDNEMYRDLEQRRKYWMSKFPDDTELDIGTEAMIRQICSLELDINRDRAAGRPVDKSINALNTCLGSANLKPSQKKQESPDSDFNNTPMGVWLYRYENKRPLPDKYNDSKILKYIFTWMGHVLKMMGKKNGYERLYQDEIDRLRVEKPEYDGSDEDLMTEYLEQEGGSDG